MNAPTISMTAWRRPDYTAAVLDALRANHGAGRYRLVVAVDAREEVDPRVLSVVHGQTWPASLEVLTMPTPKGAGCNGTTRAALRAAFAGADYVVHVEDDVLLAPDALAWFEWAREQYRADARVWTVTAWRHADGWLPGCGREPLPGEHAIGRREGGFTCWGWATWRDRWEEMDRGWTTTGDYELSWDVRVNQLRGGRVQVAPMISRAVNIGAMGGTHRGHKPLPYWRGLDPVEVPEFRED